MAPRSAPSPRRWRIAVGAGVAVGLVLSAVALRSLRPTDDVRTIALDLVTGWVLLAAGSVALRRRPESRVGDLLLLAGVAWLAGDLSPLGGVVGALAVRVAPLPLAILVHALLADPLGRLGTPERRAVAAGAYVAVLLPLLWTGAGRALVGLALAIAVLAVRWWAEPGARRANRTADLALLALAAWLVGASLVARLVPGGGRLDPGPLLDGLVVVIAGVLVAPLRPPSERRSRATASVLDLGGSAMDPLSTAIARVIDDPTARVWLRDPGSDVPVTADGAPVPPDELELRTGTTITDLPQPDGTLVRLVHRPGALDDPELLAGVARALDLLLANRRLRTELRARLDALEGSRARLLDADLAERVRLEAELDGGLGRHLDARLAEVDAILGARPGMGPERPSATVAASLARVRRELAETRVELRVLALGAGPIAVPGGLAASLAAIAARCPVPVDLAAAPGTWDPATEATVRFVAGEALTNVARHAGASRAAVVLSATPDALTLRVEDDGVGGARPAADTGDGLGLTGIEARVAEAGGSWTLDSPMGRGTRLCVTIPARHDAAAASGG
ncbi:MAG: hypothetical protein U0869_19565 [Chloroflexota bacterium]